MSRHCADIVPRVTSTLSTESHFYLIPGCRMRLSAQPEGKKGQWPFGKKHKGDLGHNLEGFHSSVWRHGRLLQKLLVGHVESKPDSVLEFYQIFSATKND